MKLTGFNTWKLEEKGEMFNAEFFNFIRFFRGKRNNRLIRSCKDAGVIHIICNGPSFEKTFHFIDEIPGDVMMVNRAYNSTWFEKLNPQYYCLADPAYFIEKSDTQGFLDEVKACLGKNNYEGVLIVPDFAKGCFDGLKCTIKYVSSNTASVTYQKKFRRKFEQNYISPHYNNVSILALYSSIQMGYNTVYLHGLDFDFVKNLHVDSQNRVTMGYPYFYNNDSEQKNREWAWPLNMCLTYYSCYTTFKNLMFLADYAKDLNVKVYNLSHNSFLDMFDKK